MAHFDFSLITFFEIGTNFFLLFVSCVCFYGVYNEFACFLTRENYFLFFIGFIRFKQVDFLEPCCPILFFNATPFMFLLSVFFSQTKQ